MASIVQVCLSEDYQLHKQQQVLYVAREPLCNHSEYFNTRLSDRWKQSQSIELKVARGDLRKYENCIMLMQALGRFSPPKFSSVEHALGILEAANRLLCPGIVKMCMDFLECRVWSAGDKLEISSTLSRLALPLSSEIAERFEGSEAEKISLLRKVVRSETCRDEALARELIDSVMDGQQPNSETVKRMKCFFEEEWMFGWSELKAEWSRPKGEVLTSKRSFIHLIPLAISYNMCNAKMVEVLFSDLKVMTPAIESYYHFGEFNLGSFFDAVRELIKKVLNGEVMLARSARKEITLVLLDFSKRRRLSRFVSHQQVKDLASTLGWKDYKEAIETLISATK